MRNPLDHPSAMPRLKARGQRASSEEIDADNGAAVGANVDDAAVLIVVSNTAEAVVGANEATQAVVHASTPRPRIYFVGMRYCIAKEEHRAHAKAAIASAFLEQAAWGPTEWKAKALELLATFRTGIVHGGVRVLPAAAGAPLPAAVGAPQMAADGSLLRARRVRPLGAKRARAAPVAPAAPSQGAVALSAAVGATGDADPLREKPRLVHPFRLGRVRLAPFGNALARLPLAAKRGRSPSKSRRSFITLIQRKARAQ